MPPFDAEDRAKPSAAPAPRRSWFRAVAALILAVALVLVAGFLVFASGLPGEEKRSVGRADGIVVLTGGASRIEDAIELLSDGRGKRLLISGVHPSTTPGEMTRAKPEHEKLFACCIDLGHRALNTIGNAVEAAQWARKHKIRSLIVVTSGWHMPRALIELENELPRVTLIPYPVVSDRMRTDPWWSDTQTARLLLLEYVKYAAAWVRVRVDPWKVTTPMLTRERP